MEIRSLADALSPIQNLISEEQMQQVKALPMDMLLQLLPTLSLHAVWADDKVMSRENVIAALYLDSCSLLQGDLQDFFQLFTEKGTASHSPETACCGCPSVTIVAVAMTFFML